MNCAMCHTGMIVKIGLNVKSKVLGDVCLGSIRHYYCPSCDERLLSAEESKRADKDLERLERTAIGQLPIDNFVTLNEASAILGVSKQAFQQNPRIKRGFVYSVKKGQSTLYDRKSVERFKAEKDGRYLLSRRVSAERQSRDVFESPHAYSKAVTYIDVHHKGVQKSFKSKKEAVQVMKFMGSVGRELCR